MTDVMREALEPVAGRTWMEAVVPLIARFETAAKFKADAVHNGEGADAIAKLMRAMAERLDYAVANYVPRAALATTAPSGEVEQVVLIDPAPVDMDPDEGPYDCGNLGWCHAEGNCTRHGVADTRLTHSAPKDKTNG